MASGTFYDAWGPTATATDSSNRYHQNHLKVTWSSDNEKVTYTINAYARSGNGSGYYYMSDYGVTVTLYYSLNGGSWQSLGSASGTLNYNDNVANITKTKTIYRTTSSQTIKFAADNTGNYLNSVSHQTGNDTMNALASYTVSYNANGGSGAPGNQTKYYGQTLTLSSTTPTRSGYSFKNWNTMADGSGTTYNAGSNYTGNAALVLYAQWSTDYESPIIGNISIIRCDSSGQQQDKGTYAKVTADWSVDSSVTGDTLTFSYKETSASSYTSIGSVTLSGTSGQANSAVFGNGNLDLNKTYSVKVELIDTKPTTVIKYGTIPVGFVTLEFLNSGTGFAIGKGAKVANKIETTLPIKLQSTNITDNIAPASSIFTGKFQFLDNNNNVLGILDSFFETNGGQYQRLLSQREINNNTYHNAIYLGLTSSGTPYISLLNDANKKAWQEALEPDVLFEGEAVPSGSGTSPSTVSLSSSAANYNHMRIYYRYFETNKPRSSVEVFEPNGKYVNLFIGYAGLNSGLYWPSSMDIYISGTNITRRYSFYTSSSTTTVRTTAAGSDTSPIYITRVEAWNDAWW